MVQWRKAIPYPLVTLFTSTHTAGLPLPFLSPLRLSSAAASLAVFDSYIPSNAMASTSGSAGSGDVNAHFSPYRSLVFVLPMLCHSLTLSRSDGKLYGFICIVTGATQPIGRAIVSELAAHGAAAVYACSVSPKDDFAGLENEVNEQYPNTKFIGYPFKLANEEDTLQLIDDVLNVWGRYRTSTPLNGMTLTMLDLTFT